MPAKAYSKGGLTTDWGWPKDPYVDLKQESPMVEHAQMCNCRKGSRAGNCILWSEAKGTHWRKGQEVIEQKLLQYLRAKTGAEQIQGEKFCLPVTLPKVWNVQHMI